MLNAFKKKLLYFDSFLLFEFLTFWEDMLKTTENKAICKQNDNMYTNVLKFGVV